MNMIERVARAIHDAMYSDEQSGAWMSGKCPLDSVTVDGEVDLIRAATAAIQAMREPTPEQWGGLARQIIFWMDMQPKTPRALFKHLDRSGHAIPQWLRDEPEMKRLDHVPSKGTRAALVYRAMIDAAAIDTGVGGG